MAQGGLRPAPKPRPQPNRTSKAGDTRSLQRHGSKRDEELTIAYIKRVLCAPSSRDGPGGPDSANRKIATQPLEALLPSLTSSGPINLQLYAFVAVILDNFVQTWYNRITPDQQFVAEIVRIIANCTNALEQRLKHVDFVDVLLDELPALLSAHIDAVKISQDTRPVDTYDVRVRYLALRPHVALDPAPVDDPSSLAQQDNEAAWALVLVNRVLPLLLPPEDLRNPCLDVLVSEIFADMIIRNGLCGKASEGWLIWDGITKAINATRPAQLGGQPEDASGGRKPEQSVLGVAAPEGQARSSRALWRLDSLMMVFWSIVQSITSVIMLLRAFGVALMKADTLPSRAESKDPRPVKSTLRAMNEAPGGGQRGKLRASTTSAPKQAIVSMQIWACLSRVFELEQRMPWLSGLLSLLQWLSLFGPGKVCCVDSRLDKFLASVVQDRVRHPHWLPPALAATRSAVFPDNALGPARPVPTADEAIEMRRACACTLLAVIPSPVRARFFATSDEHVMRQDLEATLDLFADAYINKHLLIRLTELLLVRLFPELTVDDDGMHL